MRVCRPLLTSALLLFAIPLSAQVRTISSTVADSLGGEPLADARVSVSSTHVRCGDRTERAIHDCRRFGR